MSEKTDKELADHLDAQDRLRSRGYKWKTCQHCKGFGNLHNESPSEQGGVRFNLSMPFLQRSRRNMGATNYMNTEIKPEITRRGLLDMQVCVPEDWDDAQVLAFAESENPCGTSNGWFIRRQGDDKLLGSDERVKCLGRSGCVHIMLDA